MESELHARADKYPNLHCPKRDFGEKGCVTGDFVERDPGRSTKKIGAGKKGQGKGSKE